MPTITNHMRIINKALGKIGAGKIMAEDEDTDLAGQVVPVYYSRLDAVLGMHHWSFAGRTYALDGIAKIAANDYDVAAQKFNNGWRHAFALPGTRIGLPRTILDNPRQPKNPLRDFSIEGGQVYADRAQLWAIVTVQADPNVWDPQFTLAIEAISASDFCVPVTHDDNLARSLRITAEGTPEEQGRGGLIGRAIATDAARARTAAPIWNDPLSAARFM